MTVTIGIVTGTWNRINSLVRFVESVRREIPRGLSYTITVVDGGSTDQTLEWCRTQRDITLIEHGALRGAIQAFSEGATRTDADYIFLGNDDVSLKPYSLLAALAHLEKTPTCGAVAFADNRTSLVTGDGTQYRVEGIGATTANGEKVMVAYPQVGLVRKWLGDQVGWWGWQDPVMAQARTYGGDSYLGASIWQAGYTVDAVPQAIVEDHIERDALRDRNAANGGRDSSYYYARFPTVHLPAQLAHATPSERLRILHLPVYEARYPGLMNKEPGLTEALAAYGLAIEVDYLNTPGFDLIALCRAWQPDLLITQIQGPGRITPYQLASARNAAPGMVILNWNGDAHEYGLTAPAVLELLRYVDLQTTINAKVLPDYTQHGIRAAYWQIYFKPPLEPLPAAPAHDVLFQGNCYSKERDALIKTLRSIRPSLNLGIYGNCQGANGNTHYNFAAQAALYRHATLTVGDTFPHTVAFVSNRLFQCLGNGGFLLQQHSEGLQEFTGLTPGEHFIEWTDLKDLKARIVEWLQPDKATERRAIAQAGMAFVRANFSAAAQARKLFNDLLPLIAEGERERTVV
jgi:glycosyl transferase family 2/glycosyl transferase family 1